MSFKNKTEKALVKNSYNRVRKKCKRRKSCKNEEAQASAAFFDYAFFAAFGAVYIVRIYCVTANRFGIIVIIFNVIFHVWPPNFTLWGDL
jgi:hypothetical protein